MVDLFFAISLVSLILIDLYLSFVKKSKKWRDSSWLTVVGGIGLAVWGLYDYFFMKSGIFQWVFVFVGGSSAYVSLVTLMNKRDKAAKQ